MSDMPDERTKIEIQLATYLEIAHLGVDQEILEHIKERVAELEKKLQEIESWWDWLAAGPHRVPRKSCIDGWDSIIRPPLLGYLSIVAGFGRLALSSAQRTQPADVTAPMETDYRRYMIGLAASIALNDSEQMTIWPTYIPHNPWGNTMKLSTLALAGVLAMSSTFAFAQAGGAGSGGAAAIPETSGPTTNAQGGVVSGGSMNNRTTGMSSSSMPSANGASSSGAPTAAGANSQGSRTEPGAVQNGSSR